MKKVFLITFLLVSAMGSFGHGIDGCSGSFGNFFMNFSGNPSFVGLQHSYVFAQSTSTNFWGQPIKSINHGQNTSLSLRMAFGQRISAISNIPYLLNTSITEGSSTSESGFGDSKFMLEYLVFKKSKEHSSSRVSILGGIELPTGKVNDQIFLRSFSPGSGSLDFPIALQYSFTNQKFSIFSKGIFQFNTQNNQQFKFGNQASISSLVYKNIKKEKSFFQLGLGVEAFAFGNDEFETENGTVNYNNQLQSFGTSAECLMYINGWVLKINTMMPVLTNQKKNGLIFFWNTIGINRVISKR